VNSIASSVFTTFGIKPIITGAVLSVILAFVIIGGIKRIAKVTEMMVPVMAIIYFVGSIGVIAYNYENIIPSLISVISDVFTGTAAVGGFLGAGFSFAFNRGVNRGLFSNEAGQGSAPIAHAAARAHEPVSEGLVALLEPFIDTIIICMLTGMVVLSSGLWNKKIDNQFQYTDMVILKGAYSDQNPEGTETLYQYISGKQQLETFTGTLAVNDGKIASDVTIIQSRSVAEDVLVLKEGKNLTGEIPVLNGKITNTEKLVFKGKSLIHSATLTTEAFTQSWFGSYGRYIVSIGILLFAFSTAISWSYYGGRAIIFLFGVKGDMYFRIVYVIGFFLASFTDTTIIWTLSGVTIALMTLPNLIGILMLHKEMKSEVKLFWKEWAVRFPGEKVPKG
jgi:AGCS family alanine or glycine:cation symporter